MSNSSSISVLDRVLDPVMECFTPEVARRLADSTGPKHQILFSLGQGRTIPSFEDFLSQIGGLRDEFSCRRRKS